MTSGRLYRIERDKDVDWDANLHEFTTATSEKRILTLVHGYNNIQSVGRERLITFGKILRKNGIEDNILAVLWPGDGYAKALTYPFEGLDADNTAEALSKWLMINTHKSTRIAFVGHSLGCRVVMNSAKIIAQKGSQALDRICLMAPAIDNDSLGRSGKTCYQEATLAAKKIAVLASEEDAVLHFAYPLGDLVQTILYGERWGSALGRSGPVENEQRILNQIERVPKAAPARDIGHGAYLQIDPHRPFNTIAESEIFISGFLEGKPSTTWPAQR